ncbi:ATP-binding protein [Chryseobacterium piscicola]|uniref:ATP-binding protein n=1 Tax=Chryseobacterium piscicola TaxID=551459 RepID=UPI001E4C6B85|nr:ATP-binding protein [Chryseobacterium piscicola]
MEVQIWPDKIEILSYPGPVPPVDAQILQSQQRIVARDYRNRRIGDFLKELDLTEGRGTGLPTIYKAMERNGSPQPSFNTDTQSTYFLATLPAHPLVEIKAIINKSIPKSINSLDNVISLIKSIDDGVSDGVNSIVEHAVNNKAIEMLNQMTDWISREEMFTKIGLANNSTNRKRYLDPILDLNWVKMKYPETPTHPKQQYKTTISGKNLLKIICDHLFHNIENN